MGLRKGDKVTVTPKALEARRRNARKPRGSWAGTPEREQLDEAKRILRLGLAAGAQRIADMLTGGSPVPDEIFLSAYRIAADRAGLPVLQQSQLDWLSNAPPIRVELVGFKRPNGGGDA
jgi:hypothetical protein